MNHDQPWQPAVLLFDYGGVLFVDDNAGHIDRAAALGLQVHHFGDEAGFAAELVRRWLRSDQSDKSDPSGHEAMPK